MGRFNFTKMRVLSLDEKNIIITTNFKRCTIRYNICNDGFMYIDTSDNMDIYDVARFIRKLFYPNKNFKDILTFWQNLDSVGFYFNGCSITITKQEAKVNKILRQYVSCYKRKWKI